MDFFNLTIVNKNQHQEFQSLIVKDLQMTDAVSKINFQVMSEALLFEPDLK